MEIKCTIKTVSQIGRKNTCFLKIGIFNNKEKIMVTYSKFSTIRKI